MTEHRIHGPCRGSFDLVMCEVLKRTLIGVVPPEVITVCVDRVWFSPHVGLCRCASMETCRVCLIKLNSILSGVIQRQWP